ncbi:MAG: biotin--[acetyl-CoA-carboxylase] ligase [Acidaminococcales bacterium]|jgi:BirA family biotin operon repressor/biotin-[acetyl-CoA-carboxylase] ligase|nr:biotin--[acetyl-CoA-carboxylase] ligase [Acidaminococcales bacterium]
MRDKIISILREHIGSPLSGEEISKKILISRTAVWKHIRQLKQAGYDIQAVNKKGYILSALPDLVLPGEITSCLATRWLGRNIIYRGSVKSTNDIAKQAALEGCPHGTVIVAEEQSGGRGRLARGWFSPLHRGLWFSVVLRPPFLPQEAPKLTLLMAVVLAEALAVYPGVQTGIKWPNDILLQGKKISGILTEMSAEMEAINYVVIGTGLNTNTPEEILPVNLREKAGSLNDFAALPVSRARLLSGILAALEKIYDETIKSGFIPVLKRWREYSVTLGRKVRVDAPDESFAGEAVDIDETGALLVRRASGKLEKVLAGDVSVRTADGEGYI